MQITNNFTIPSSEPSQGRISGVNRDAQHNAEQNGKQQDNSVVISPDERGSNNAKAYQKFIREDSHSASKYAIASYTSFEKQQQRESVQSMFGVDVYA